MSDDNEIVFEKCPMCGEYEPRDQFAWYQGVSRPICKSCRDKMNDQFAALVIGIVVGYTAGRRSE